MFDDLIVCDSAFINALYFIQQINFLRLSSSALIKAKKLELNHKRKQQAKDEGKGVEPIHEKKE